MIDDTSITANTNYEHWNGLTGEVFDNYQTRFYRCLIVGMTCTELIYSQLRNRLRRKKKILNEIQLSDQKLSKMREFISDNERMVILKTIQWSKIFSHISGPSP